GLSLISLGTSLARSGRSRTCPMLASTRNLAPRNRDNVLAFAGDSTMTRGFAIRRSLPYHCCRRRPEGPAGQPDDAAGDLEAADDPVPAREVLRLRFGCRRQLGNDRAARGNHLGEGSVLGGIDAIEPTAEHADGRARVERALVGGLVDASGQAAGDHEAEAG